ncbi:MAG: LuxR C-terminal-related transcriptional regulator, partial [Actinomycetia bacterium]|nr:LuxR C-terminal-related transcriptional regulator [Actinomycetes bacterium]
AAQMTADDATRAERFIAAGECAWLAGLPDKAEHVLAEALVIADSVVVAGAVAGLRGGMAMQVGSLAEARHTLFDAGELLTSCDPDAAVHAYADLVHACFHLADTSAGLEAARRIDSLLPDVRSERVRVRGRMAIGIARVLAGEAGIEQIRGAVTELTAFPDEADDPLRPEWSVLGPLFLREAQAGRAIVDHVLGEVRARCAIGRLPRLLFHVSRIHATTARWQEALAGYHEGIDLARETGLTTDLTTCLAGLAWLQARMGREQECRESAAEALRLAATHDIHLAKAWSWFALGELALALGRPDEAVQHLTSVDELLATTGFRDVDLAPAPELVEAFVRLGDVPTATKLASDFRVRADAKGQPWACARAQRALGLVDASASRDAYFERALSLHAASPDDYEEARTELVWGAVLRRDRQRVAARPHLRAALSTFERLGAGPWAAQAATELAATGEAVVRAGGSALDALTPQELRIAQLLAAGRTTREAATELFLSPKTVEYHLRHVYTKLDIHSRPELMETLRGA